MRLDKETLKELNKVIKLAKNLSTEINFKGTEKGIRFTLMDSANVAMLYSELALPEAVKSEGTLETDTLFRLLKKFGNEVDIEFKDTEVVLSGNGKRGTLRIIDSFKEEKIPDLKYGEKVEIDGAEILEVAEFSEAMDFVTEEGKLKLFAGDDFGLKFEAEIKTENKLKKKSRFSCDYINKIVLREKIKVSVEDDYPLLVDYGNIKLVLAPRIESD